MLKGARTSDQDQKRKSSNGMSMGVRDRERIDDVVFTTSSEGGLSSRKSVRRPTGRAVAGLGEASAGVAAWGNCGETGPGIGARFSWLRSSPLNRASGRMWCRWVAKRRGSAVDPPVLVLGAALSADACAADLRDRLLVAVAEGGADAGLSLPGCGGAGFGGDRFELRQGCHAGWPAGVEGQVGEGLDEFVSGETVGQG